MVLRTILITGSNGLLGQQLIQKLYDKKDVKLIATSKNSNICHIKQGYVFERMDITNFSQTDYIISLYKPDVIINCAGMTQPDPCETNRVEAWNANVEAVDNLAQISNKYNIHLIHLSTDFVFDGIRGMYKEDDLPNPLNYYGLTKLEGEKVAFKTAQNVSIIRTVLVYGIFPEMARSNILKWVLNQLKNNQSIRVVDDQFRTPTYVADLAEACLMIAEKKKYGLYHISGNEYLSVFDFAKKIASAYKLDVSLISPVPSAQLNEIAKRPPKTGFHIYKASRDLGYKPTSIDKALQIIVNS